MAAPTGRALLDICLKKRPTLRQELDRMEQMPDDELNALVDELEAVDQGAAARVCPLCAADDTIGEPQKAKQWDSEVKLKAHIDSAHHAPVAKWKRRMETNRLADPQQRCLCPYCVATNKELKSYSTVKELLRHVMNSTAKSAGDEHDRLKTEDGFYEPDFIGSTSEETGKRRLVLGKRSKEEADVHFDDEAELAGPIPHPTRPGLQFGDFHPRVVPARFQGHIIESDAPLPYTEVPEHLKGVIIESDGPLPYTGVPEHLNGLVVESDEPQPLKFPEH